MWIVNANLIGRFRGPGIASNIQKNISALVMRICITFTCFQTLRPRKSGSLHETGFSLPHRYHFDGRSSSQPRFGLLEVEAKCGDIHTSNKSQISLTLRHATDATEISLLRSLVASQQQEHYRIQDTGYSIRMV